MDCARDAVIRNVRRARLREVRRTYFAMHPTVDFDFFELPLYTVLVMLGVGLGLAVTYIFLRMRSRRAASPSNFLNGALVVFIAGWVGARAYHVAAHWDYYAARPDEIAQIGLGGLAMRGALILGFVAVIFFARWRGLKLARILDAAALGLSLGQAIGWAGALAQGANYGVVSDSPIAIDLPDIYGLVAPRFPAQHAEIILFAVLFVSLLIFASSQPRAGMLFVVYLIIASAANLALGFVRGDETLLIGAMRLDQWVDGGFLGLAPLFYLFVHRRKVGVIQ